jgi:hypothetical protein
MGSSFTGRASAGYKRIHFFQQCMGSRELSIILGGQLKTGQWCGPGRDSYLSRFLLIRQVSFGSPTPRSAFEYMAMME